MQSKRYEGIVRGIVHASRNHDNHGTPETRISTRALIDDERAPHGDYALVSERLDDLTSESFLKESRGVIATLGIPDP